MERKINKITLNGVVQMDLTSDTATVSDVKKGVYFHDKSGKRLEGTLDLTAATASAEHVLQGKTFIGPDGATVAGTLVLDDFSGIITATADDVRIGKTFIDSNGDATEGALNMGYTLKELVDGVEVLSVDNESILTSWGDLETIPDFFYVGGGNGKLKTVRFDNVTGIGESAFARASGLENIIFPKCTEIKSYAFGHVSSENYASNTVSVPLTGNVYLPEVEKVGSGVFMGCGAEHISLPKLKYVQECYGGDWQSYTGHNVFTSSAVKSLDLPKLEAGGWEMFKDCINLETISLPEATQFEGDTFNGCTSLTSVDCPKMINPGLRAFYDCKSLKSINLPNVTTLYPDAFYNCTELEEINLPNLTTLSTGAWSNLSIADCNYFLPDYTTSPYPAVNKLKRLILPKLNIEFESGKSYPILFGSGPCGLMPDLEEIDLSSQEYLGNSNDLLSYCQILDCLHALKKVKLDSCKGICTAAFASNPIETITLPNCLFIGNYAFGGCNNLVKADLHKCETMYNAFQSCPSLKTLIIRTSKVCELMSAYAFELNDGSNPNFSIYVPDNLVDSYKTAQNWSMYANYFKPLSSYVEE